jgi:hypothetical protein
MSWLINRDACRKPSPALSFDEMEQLLIRAYVKLVFMSKDRDGLRTAIVAQFGSLEVRLTEFCDAYIFQDKPPLWVEIYSHATYSMIDSRGFLEFNEEELSEAVGLIMQAKQHREIYH